MPRIASHRTFYEEKAGKMPCYKDLLMLAFLNGME